MMRAREAEEAQEAQESQEAHEMRDKVAGAAANDEEGGQTKNTNEKRGMAAQTKTSWRIGERK